MIPKIIHYCWFGPKKIPEIMNRCIGTWESVLKDYDLMLWNENNSPMNQRFVSQAYEKKNFAFVSDYVRFWALYKYGGIYLDTDMYVLKSFDDLLPNDCFFGWETDLEENLSCGVIGANKGNDFIEHIISCYEDIEFSQEKIAEIVIPRIVTRCYDQYISKDKISVLPYSYFYSFPYSEKENFRNFMNYKTNDSYAVHLWNISWGKKRHKLRDWFIYHLKKVLK
jgi:mannosyltransferase OCH1-like enzyme